MDPSHHPNSNLHDSGRQVALPIAPQHSDNPLMSYAERMLHLNGKDTAFTQVLEELEAHAEAFSIPIIGRFEGAIIQLLVKMLGTQPKQILDIGTATGYSALWLADSMPPGSKVTSIEIDPERARLAQANIQKAGFANQIQIIVGDVMEILPQLNTQFDIIFQDVIKHVYFGQDSKLALDLLDLCLVHLTDGGLLLGDNAFCMGEVLLENIEDLPKQVVGIQAYNARIATHPKLQSVILPVRDGLWASVYRNQEA